MKSVYLVIGVTKSGREITLRVCGNRDIAETVAQDKRNKWPCPYDHVKVDPWGVYGTTA